MNIYELRNLVDAEIIDFNQLSFLLRHYKHPRGKINQWLKTRALIRVKKGLYVFGEHVRRNLYSLELLANLIYGPSAISLHYALSYYGLIPEAVHTITSITCQRNKIFNTPVGHFTYTYLNATRYPIDIQLQQLSHHVHVLIASPEKALCDVILLSSQDLHINGEQDVIAFLFDDLRIDEDLFKKLSFSSIQRIAEVYKDLRLHKFVKCMLLWVDQHA